MPLVLAGAWISHRAFQESSGTSEDKVWTFYHKSEQGMTILILSAYLACASDYLWQREFTGQFNNSSRGACLTFTSPSPGWKLSISQFTPLTQSKKWEPKNLHKRSCLESQTRTVSRFHRIIQAGIFLPWLVSQMFKTDKPLWSCAKSMCLNPFSPRLVRSSDQTWKNLKDFRKFCQNTLYQESPLFQALWKLMAQTIFNPLKNPA